MDTVKRAPLARPDAKGRPVLVTSQWPVMVQDYSGKAVRQARFMIEYAHREEKGSDVNVATHLLLDTMEKRIDAAIVVSNDSDLCLPIREAKRRIPVGLVNPTSGYLAGALSGQATFGVGGRWWLQLTSGDYTGNQLPDPCAGYAKPKDW